MADSSGVELGKLIQLPTSQLVAKFAGGGHKPGSGSAAALSGVFAAALLTTVIKLTLKKAEYVEVFPEMTVLQDQVQTLREQFVERFHEDAIQFDRVMQLRLQIRDGELDASQKRVIRERELEALRVATETPIQIAKLAINLADKALYIFDYGFRGARGDSGVAIQWRWRVRRGHSSWPI